MITFQITGHLTDFTGGAAEIKVDAQPATVREALNELWNRHAGLRDRVLTEQGEVRQHVNIFVNSSVVRRDKVLDTSLDGTADICIMPAVSGGADLFPLPFGRGSRLEYHTLVPHLDGTPKGVRKFQPRATPWVASLIVRGTLKEFTNHTTKSSETLSGFGNK